MAILSFSPLDHIGLQVPTYRPTTIVYPLRHRGSSFMRFPLLYYMAEDTMVEEDIRVCGEIRSIFDEVVYQLKIYNELNVIQKQYQLNMNKQIVIDTNELLYRQRQICALSHSIQVYNKQNAVDIFTAKQLMVERNGLAYINNKLLVSKQTSNITIQYQTLLKPHLRNMIQSNITALTINNNLLYTNQSKQLSTVVNTLMTDHSNINISTSIKLVATNIQLLMYRINLYNNSIVNHPQQVEKYNKINYIAPNILSTCKSSKNIAFSANHIGVIRQKLFAHHSYAIRLKAPKRYIVQNKAQGLQRQLRENKTENTMKLTPIVEYLQIASQPHQLKSIAKNINTFSDIQMLVAKNKVNNIYSSIHNIAQDSKRSIATKEYIDIVKQPHLSQFSSIIINATKMAKASRLNITTMYTQRSGQDMKIISSLAHIITSISHISMMQTVLCNKNNRIISTHNQVSPLVRFGQICTITNIMHLQRSNTQLSVSNIASLSRDRHTLRINKPNSRLARIASHIQTTNDTQLIKSTAHNIKLETIMRTHKYFKIGVLNNHTALTKNSKIIQTDNSVAQSHLHRRLWFIRNNNQPTDSIILPSDYDYPVKIESFNSDIDGYSKFQWQNSFAKYDRPLMVKIYDAQYNLLEYFYMKEDYANWLFYEHTTSQGRLSVSTTNHITSCKLTIFNPRAAYITIQHPKDNDGYTAWYAVAKPILAQSHPIPIGNDLGLRELPVPIEILVETINILLLMWSKFFMAFTGQTGIKAISGLCATFHEWITLATSQEQAGTNIKYYYRMWRWLRWESECIIEKAKYDPELTGNYWVEQLLTEMQDYMLQHHFNYMPLFKDIEKMDEHRNIFNSPDNNIEFILDKYKGLRNRRIEEC